jgi:hypothetical protein
MGRLSPTLETSEARLAKDRIRNSSRAAFTRGPAVANIGMQGAVAYALLDIASAIRDAGADDPGVNRLLAVADSIVDLIADGAPADRIARAAVAYRLERDGFDVDQLVAPVERPR